MKRISVTQWVLLTMLLLVCGSGPLPAQEKQPTGPSVILEEQSLGLGRTEVEGKQQVIYVVQTGDTLFDIAKRFLNSPYYWPVIWERNEFIINPNLIYPGDVLNLYPVGEKLTTEIPEELQAGGGVLDVPEISPLAPGQKRLTRVIYKRSEGTGFISVSELEATGTIIDSYAGAMLGKTKLRKTLLGTHDLVYVNVGTTLGVREGDIFSVFRLAEDATGNPKQVKHPLSGEVVGYRVVELGELQITKIKEDVAEAKIINSYENVAIGDRIKPYVKEGSDIIDIVPSTVEIYGNIIAAKNQTQLFGKDEIVYIDRGEKDGVVRGVIFEVYIPGEEVYDPDVGKKTILPDKRIGALVVVEPKETTSVGLVIESTQEFTPGEHIRTLQY